MSKLYLLPLVALIGCLPTPKSSVLINMSAYPEEGRAAAVRVLKATGLLVVDSPLGAPIRDLPHVYGTDGVEDCAITAKDKDGNAIFIAIGTVIQPRCATIEDQLVHEFFHALAGEYHGHAPDGVFHAQILDGRIEEQSYDTICTYADCSVCALEDEGTIY